MSPDSFFAKTQAGIDAVARNDRSLTVKSRQLLIMIQPNQPIGMVMQKLGLDPARDGQYVDELVRLGYVQQAENKLASGFGDSSILPRIAKGGVDPVVAAQRYLLKVSESILSDRKHPLYRSIESATTQEELLACAESCRKIILSLSDRSAASQFMQIVEAHFKPN